MTTGLCTLDLLLAPEPLDEPSVVYIASNVVLGLDHLHRSGVIYRGLCPSSLLVTEGCQVGEGEEEEGKGGGGWFRG